MGVLNLMNGIFKKVSKKPNIPICIFTHHKCGTTLFRKCFKEIAIAFDWNFIALKGYQKRIPEGYDIILFSHSGLDFNLNPRTFRGVHLSRNYKDILISGYLYHKRCREKWCLNENFQMDKPILFPQIPYSQQHQPYEWKKTYISNLNGLSYQKNLLQLSQEKGILFEMERYASWTIQDLQQWNHTRDNVLEIQFEKVMEQYQSTFQEIFEYLEFQPQQIKKALHIIKKHDLSRMSSEQIDMNPMIHATKTSKWEDYWSDSLEKEWCKRINE